MIFMTEQVLQALLGFHPVVWLESLYKRLIEATSGRGGLEALCQYLCNIDFIPELVELRRNIGSLTTFFETALSKCNREMLRRPRRIREDEATDLLGSRCVNCNFKCSNQMMIHYGGKCPVCGGSLELEYVLAVKELLKQGIAPDDPEIPLMYVAYDALAEAYVNAYIALNLVMSKTAEFFNWQRFRLEREELKNYMDRYFLGELVGETKIPREEKQILQFLVRGNMAGIPIEKAEQVIRLGISVVKYGYLYQVLGASGALDHFKQALAEYNTLYNEVNSEIRLALAIKPKTEKTTIRITKTLGGYYAPCLMMAEECWVSGQISGELTLDPVYRLPVFPKRDYGALQAVFGRLGSGKTFLLSSLICYSVLAKRELVFVPLNDKSNTYSLASIPLFAYNRQTERLLEYLTNILGVEPQGLPTITLNILRAREEIKDVSAHPPTIYDRIIRIEDPKGFIIDFNVAVKWLKEVASDYGYSKPVGVICVRNLDRQYGRQNINIDVQAATQMIWLFEKWRRNHLSQPARVTIDEISYLAPSQVALYASDALRSGAMISDFIKESRRNRVSVDVATQRPLEILPDIRSSATNIFFRDLATSRDKSRSEIEFMLESVQLKDPAVRDVIREINEKNLLPKFFWFWYHRPSRTIHVIRPTPPTFLPQDPNLTPRQLIRKYEKASGQRILLKSWSQVPAEKAETQEPEETIPEIR